MSVSADVFEPLQPVLTAFDEGRPALFLSGRSLYDLVAVDGKLRPLVEVLRARLRSCYGMHLITYSLAAGVDWNDAGLADARDRSRVEQALRTARLLDLPQDQNEVARVIRGVSTLARMPADGLAWSDGRALRFAFVLEFAEHLAPGAMNNGSQTDAQLVAIELAHLTGHSLALRSTGNFVIFHGREGLLDDLVSCALHHVRLPQPARDEKAAFIEAASAVYAAARFEDGLTAGHAAHITSNTPNRTLEGLLRASHRSGRVITSAELVDQKTRDVAALSDESLTVLDAKRASGAELVGRNIVVPRRVLQRLAEGLRREERSMPATILLAGPPGNGKTDLALLASREAGVAAYEMNSPKRPFVGQTEMVAKRQQQLLREWVPNVAVTDEITEAFPLERREFDGDSGASRAVTAALLTALSDESRRGRSLLVATTNCPWRIGEAMRSRFTVIPVLHPLLQDYPAIIGASARRLVPGIEITSDDPRVQEAAAELYRKGASPRHIVAALGQALLHMGRLDADAIRFAADDFCPAVDWNAVVYADLWAVRACSSRSFLPWSDDPRGFPYPDHLRGVVDAGTGHIVSTEVNRALAELRAHVNL